jgi:hypothetical protein
MFPILNVSNKGFNQMSSLKEQIDAMTPEQVMAELPLARSELKWEQGKKVALLLAFAAGILYLVFGM